MLGPAFAGSLCFLVRQNNSEYVVEGGSPRTLITIATYALEY